MRDFLNSETAYLGTGAVTAVIMLVLYVLNRRRFYQRSGYPTYIEETMMILIAGFFIVVFGYLTFFLLSALALAALVAGIVRKVSPND